MAFGNGYAFVGSNPGTYWDPYGDSGWGLWDAVCDFVSDAIDMVGDALSAAGEMIGEFAAGVVEGVVGSIKGIVNAALHPIDTLNGLIELAKTIAGDPKAFLDKLIKELSQMSPAELARALGRLAGESLVGMATAGSAAAVNQVSKVANNARRFANRWGPSRRGSCQGDKCFVGDTLVSTPSGDRPIDEIRVGQRVHSRAHADSVSAATLGRDCDESDRGVAPKSPEEPQLAISLTVTGATGTVYEIELLRSAEWLEKNRAEDGRVFLRLDELGLLGWATIDTVQRTEVEEGPGGLVTATIVSTSRVLYDVTVGEDVIRATGRHPVFSLDRDAWVPVSALRRGERLASESGEAVAVLDIERLVVSGTKVYNIEVDGTHAYHVGTAGVLVHNAGGYGDTVTLHHGSQSFVGDKFDLDIATSQQRPGTPAPGVHLTDDFHRAAQGYGRGGDIASVEVPRELAEELFEPNGGPFGKQPEYVARTPEQVQALNDLGPNQAQDES